MSKLLRRAAMWLVWNGPYLGRLGPHLFAFGMGCKNYRRVR